MEMEDCLDDLAVVCVEEPGRSELFGSRLAAILLVSYANVRLAVLLAAVSSRASHMP